MSSEASQITFNHSEINMTDTSPYESQESSIDLDVNSLPFEGSDIIGRLKVETNTLRIGITTLIAQIQSMELEKAAKIVEAELLAKQNEQLAEQTSKALAKEKEARSLYTKLTDVLDRVKSCKQVLTSKSQPEIQISSFLELDPKPCKSTSCSELLKSSPQVCYSCTSLIQHEPEPTSEDINPIEAWLTAMEEIRNGISHYDKVREKDVIEEQKLDQELQEAALQTLSLRHLLSFKEQQLSTTSKTLKKKTRDIVNTKREVSKLDTVIRHLHTLIFAQKNPSKKQQTTKKTLLKGGSRVRKVEMKKVGHKGIVRPSNSFLLTLIKKTIRPTPSSVDTIFCNNAFPSQHTLKE